MRVTDEMLERAQRAVDATPGNPVRVALEAVLAHMPEPGSIDWEATARHYARLYKESEARLAHLADWQRLADEHMEAKNEATARVRALEAQLARVRQWRDRHQQWWHLNHATWSELEALLDGREGA